MAALLDVRDLSVEFRTDAGGLRAVDGVSFQVEKGSIVGLVGESGSGKSATAGALLRLNDARLSGSVRLGELDLLQLPAARLREVRGKRVAMIFQDPSASLNPAMTIGAHLVEAIRTHQAIPKATARVKAEALLAQVGIPEPAERMGAYPHQLSGGMRQRVMIAIALSCDPELLIADEPTTALDVTIQAQILDLLRRLRESRGMSILLITHDLGLVAEVCDEVVVLYAGRVIERGAAARVLASPAHPYTAGLLASAPVPGGSVARLTGIPGVVPDLRRLPPGCRFQDRCGFVQERCRAEEPPLIAIREIEHRCFFPLPGPGAEPRPAQSARSGSTA